ncbi:MAG: sigma-54 dependent transcriptional regulator [Marinilabiliaceae bacterium]|nr:sigma-54 dependent transcriptional regulator [Marinilabiliaceae bacterium]
MILIADDDPAIRVSISLLLKNEGYETLDFAQPIELIDFIRHTTPDAIILDMNFTRETSGDEGLKVLKQIKLFQPTVPVILITGWGSIDLAVAGMKAGAFDFITKPWNNKLLLDSINNALVLSKKILNADNNSMTRAQLDKNYQLSDIIGKSPAIMEILKTVVRISQTNAPVLITGESGTGKELIAEAIHKNSQRSKAPFVKVNLGGISQSLFESEMFGHKKGAFTDAHTDRKGRFAISDGGTIFLDEIGELDLASQVKLLRVLQEQTFEMLGDSSTQKIDVRVICATNKNLQTMIEQGLFREDLFYRINLIQIEMPTLRERVNDIILLGQYFANRITTENNLPTVNFSEEASQLLINYHFPGNIRELKNLIERTILMSGKTEIEADDFKMPKAQEQLSHFGTLEDVERQTIIDKIKIHNGNMSKVAQTLGLSRGALYRRLEKLDIRV